MRRATRVTRDGLDATTRDMANRARGIAAATRGRLSREPVDDVKLIERVRAQLGRACSHPRAIDVEAHEGHVTLRGPILAHEVNGLCAAVASVRGVQDVTNALDVHESSDRVPSLQGGDKEITGPSLDIAQRRWAPSTRALLGAGAALLLSSVAVAYARRGSHAHDGGIAEHRPEPPGPMFG
jgi:hypothetical protein